MKQLNHNSILVLPRYRGKGFIIKAKGKKILLTSEQEEMAFAWAKKAGTAYTEDSIFAKNFHYDFSKKLGISVKPSDVDYSDIIFFIEEERAQRANLSKEGRKELTIQRKKLRERNKARYGYAWVDGVQMEVANYTSEPSSIFIGRGSHPLRGHWKEGPREEDIELNLSPDAIKPQGNWKAILWKPDSMWIARWKDKLSGKMKYVWFSESSIMKQSKEISKFNKSRELFQNISQVQKHIKKNLDANDLKRRKIATVCFLIDKLKIRVGDEKDPDEADTVGASTLRPEHLRFNNDDSVTFNFLGKDSIPHLLKAKLPAKVSRNLKDLASNARSSLFNGVSSRHISEFLDEVMKGLSAKTFRTYYASKVVETKLEETPVKPENLEYKKKYVATIANLEAAKVCNHRRTISKTWKSSLDKKIIRLRLLNKRAKEGQKKLKKVIDRDQNYKERLKKKKVRLEAMKEKLETYLRQLVDKEQQGKPVLFLKKRISLKRKAIARQKLYLKKLKTQHVEWKKKQRQKLEYRKYRDKVAIEKLRYKIKVQKETRDYNLTTSLKSYIDPRIYFKWGKQVDYNWKRYYSKALQKKFSWVELDGAYNTT